MNDPAVHTSLHARQLRLLGDLHASHARRLESLQESIYPGYRFPWRIAEGPALLPRELFDRDASAMRKLLESYATPAFHRDHVARIPARWRRGDGASWFPKFVATDYQRVFDRGEQRFDYAVPEIQSFPGNLLLKPTLLQSLLPSVPGMEPRHAFLNAETRDFDAYLRRLWTHTFGDADPKSSIILELAPLEQKTVVDMLLWVKHFGIRLVDLRDAFADERTGEVQFRRAIAWSASGPREQHYDRPERATCILSRCLPGEVEDEMARPGTTLDPVRVRAIFHDSLARGAAQFVVHPQDFFVLSKDALVGNPHQWPPLLPLTKVQLTQWRNDGTDLGRGILKPTDRAGGQGLRGLDSPLTLTDVARRLEEDGEGRWLWQEKYGADEFARAEIPGFVSGKEDETGPIYHELRLMWAIRSEPGQPRFEAELMTGMTRWSRVGDPANAGRQRTAFTGTHGLLVM